MRWRSPRNFLISFARLKVEFQSWTQRLSSTKTEALRLNDGCIGFIRKSKSVSSDNRIMKRPIQLERHFGLKGRWLRVGLKGRWLRMAAPCGVRPFKEYTNAELDLIHRDRDHMHDLEAPLL